MTNAELITDAAIKQGVFTKEEAIAYLENGYSLPLHTFAVWKSLGYKVKKGEHAKLKCTIWNYKNKKKEVADDEEVDERNFYLHTACFFTREQVEPITA